LAVLEGARDRGWARAQLHAEQFAAASHDGCPFTVVLSRRGIQVPVAADQSILEALEQAHVGDVPMLCREGYCGTCETGLLEGEADHRDQYLQPTDKDAQRTIMICVSRARTPRLVLDL
jgi:ferredoxin